MGRNSRLEARLAALEALRQVPTAPTTLTTLRQALGARNCHVVAKATQLVGDLQLVELVPEMVDAFRFFMVNPQKTDPSCTAKTAIADALVRLEAEVADIFLDGIGHHQFEPVRGGVVDTASSLRGISAMGLVRLQVPGTMLLLAQLLADPEAEARTAAARAIGESGDPAGIPLLRFKALLGDVHPQVQCECLGALLQLDPEPSLSFVASFLQHEDAAVRRACAVALGESQMVQALPFLETAWEDAEDRELRQAYLVAIALLRHERALEFLLDLIARGGDAANDALMALRMYRDDPRIWSRVVAAREAQSAGGEASDGNTAG